MENDLVCGRHHCVKKDQRLGPLHAPLRAHRRTFWGEDTVLEYYRDEDEVAIHVSTAFGRLSAGRKNTHRVLKTACGRRGRNGSSQCLVWGSKGIGIYLSRLSRLTEICIFGFRIIPVVSHPKILRTHLQQLITGYNNQAMPQHSSANGILVPSCT